MATRSGCTAIIIVFGALLSGQVVKLSPAHAQIHKAEAFGKVSLPEPNPPDGSIFMGKQATFRYEHYDVDNHEHMVFVRQSFSATKRITAGFKSTNASVNLGSHHRTVARTYWLIEGFAGYPPRASSGTGSRYLPIYDQGNAETVTVGARLEHRSACRLTNLCLPSANDIVRIQPFWIVRGDTIAPIITPFVYKFDWGDGLPVDLHAGFSSGHPQPSNKVEIGISDNKMYLFDPQSPLSCGQSPCYQVPTTWANSSGSIHFWSNNGSESQPPLKIYTRAIIWVSQPPPALIPNPVGFGHWFVCMGDLLGTPCKIELPPPVAVCNSSRAGSKYPDSSTGPWHCLEVVQACWDVPQYQATPPPNIGLFNGSSIIYPMSPCGACDVVRIENGNFDELASAASLSVNVNDCYDTDDTILMYIPGERGWPDAWRIKTDNTTQADNTVERYVPWDFDEVPEKECWGDDTGWQWVYLKAESSFPDYCP